jgi:hypothetical protein
MQWKNKIVGYDMIDPKKIKMHDKNWRNHPKFQVKVLNSILGNIGWVSGVIINKRSLDSWNEEKGIETLVDGHCRVQAAIDNKINRIPVVYVNLSPEEENAILATYDAIGKMSEKNIGSFEKLTSEINTEDIFLIDLFDRLKDNLDDFEDIDFEEPSSDKTKKESNGGKVIFKYNDEEGKKKICEVLGIDGMKSMYLASELKGDD